MSFAKYSYDLLTGEAREELRFRTCRLHHNDFGVRTVVRDFKVLGAHAFLMGSFTKLDKKKMRIDARLVKTETGELIKAEKVEGNPKDFAELQAELALKVAAGLDIAVKESEEEAIRAEGRLPIEAVLA